MIDRRSFLKVLSLFPPLQIFSAEAESTEVESSVVIPVIPGFLRKLYSVKFREDGRLTLVSVQYERVKSVSRMKLKSLKETLLKLRCHIWKGVRYQVYPKNLDITPYLIRYKFEVREV